MQLLLPLGGFFLGGAGGLFFAYEWRQVWQKIYDWDLKHTHGSTSNRIMTRIVYSLIASGGAVVITVAGAAAGASAGLTYSLTQ